MRIVRIEKHPLGRRVYLSARGRRVRLHHGLVCFWAAVGCALGAWTDRHDFPWTRDD